MNYRTNKIKTAKILNHVDSYEGESLEKKLQRMLQNREPMTDHVSTVYTERKDGVMAAYNIRTDKHEIACEAMDKVHQTNSHYRQERRDAKVYDTMSEEQRKKFHETYPKNPLSIKALALSQKKE